MVIPSKLYDKLKWIALIVVPASVVFYDGLGSLWNWSHTREVAGSLALFGVFLGSLLQLSSQRYNNKDTHTGSIELAGYDPDTGMPQLHMNLGETTPDELLTKKAVRLKVKKSTVAKPVHRSEPEEH